MKQLLTSTLLLLALLLPATTTAHDFEVDGIYYLKNGNNATVTYKGTYSSQYSEYTGDVTIPSTVTYNSRTYSVTAIGYGAFSWCESLASVTIPNSVTSIGDEAFMYCSGLTSVTIPNSVTTIGKSAFEYCHSLTNVSIGNSVTSIGDYAFRWCSGLTSVIIPNSVTSIGEGAFDYCEGLSSVSIGNSVAFIGGYAFSDCTSAFHGCVSLTSIIVDSGNATYDSRNNCNAIIETSNNTLIVGCKNTVISNSITAIGDVAFRDCIGLTSVTIPNSVTAIGGAAFLNSGLTSLTISNSVTTIGECAFDDTPWFNNQPDGLVYAGLVAYKYKGTMPEDTIITIREGTLGVGGFAFGFCEHLTSVIIPNSVTTIGDGAFYNCSGLTSVNIPNSVTSIGDWAFEMCSSLNEVYSYIVDPSAIAMGHVFSRYPGNYSDRTLHVPVGSLEAYQEDTRWSDYFGRIVEGAMPGDVDFDCRISIADVTELIDMLLRGDVGVDNNPAADVNGNGIINIADVVELIDQLLN